MIARITGILIELNCQTNTVLLDVPPLVYEVMVPRYVVGELADEINRTVTFYCLEYYESVGQGSSFVPRLVGFPQVQDKAFFQRFISVKGIGIRKALRALAGPIADIAYSIENGDGKMLATLPEIGKRTAEQIIAELKGKMQEFASQPSTKAQKAVKPLTAIEKEALEILLQLGERRSDAEELISKIVSNFSEIKTTDALVQAVYRMKSGVL